MNHAIHILEVEANRIERVLRKGIFTPDQRKIFTDKLIDIKNAIELIENPSGF